MSEQKWFEYYVSNVKDDDIGAIVHILNWYVKTDINPTYVFLEKILTFGFHPYILFVLKKVNSQSKKNTITEGWILGTQEELDDSILSKFEQKKKLNSEIESLKKRKREFEQQLNRPKNKPIEVGPKISIQRKTTQHVRSKKLTKTEQYKKIYDIVIITIILSLILFFATML